MPRISRNVFNEFTRRVCLDLVFVKIIVYMNIR